MNSRLFLISFLFFISNLIVQAQTASSLFHLRDSVQVGEIVSVSGQMLDSVGHCGPAVENSHMILRILFDDRCAVDLYSKTGRGMELLKYKWYPSESEISEYAVGSDNYEEGNTLGFGGVALWDGEKIVRLTASSGRIARVGNTSKGSYAEMISYGVVCGNDTVDVCFRIDVFNKKRQAKVTVRELSGKKVRFVTGVNFHKGQTVVMGDGMAYVWGAHPCDSTKSPVAVGAGIRYSAKKFEIADKTEDMVMLVSYPSNSITTTLVGTSVKEAELNTLKRFDAFMRD